LKEDGRMIGFLSIYAVRQDLVPLAIASQKPIFDVESPEHLIPRITGPADGYIHNIILDPEYRGCGYRRYLYLGLRYWLDKHPGIGYLWADAVSEYGQRALKGLGLEPSPALPRLWGGETQSVLEALERQLEKGEGMQDVTLEG
jgi:GNAT superfamily N-acetyltransferase